jgi:hypothetical protein
MPKDTKDTQAPVTAAVVEYWKEKWERMTALLKAASNPSKS